MASVIQSNFRVRKNLGRVQQIIEVPNLIDIQKSSYDKFLQTDVPPNNAPGGGPPGRVPQRVPDQGLQRHERARVRLATTWRSPSTTSMSAASAA